MTDNDLSTLLSPTVVHVLGNFTEAMHGEDDIPDYAVERLDALLKKGTVPKADDISAALFDPAPEGET